MDNYELEIIEPPLDPKFIPAPYQEDVLKHGNHDQKTHGSWSNGEPTSSLNDEENSALTDYIKKGYLFINGFLRKRDSMGAEDLKIQTEKQEPKIKLMDSVFDKVPPLQEEILVHRGVVGVIAVQLNDAPVGSTFVDKGFVSTTNDVGIAEYFGSFNSAQGNKKALLNITVPKGTKALRVADFIKDDQVATIEAETILPRGLKYEITGRNGYEIQLKVVPNE